MESTDLDMDEIFDDNDIDDDVGATGVLPDLEPTQPQDNEEDENAEVLARLKDLSKGAAKKVVRKPQPKLDPTRLTGDRGIPILPKLFKDVKFKGKGHESHDLAILMRQMEHWGHRLFPKMPFDEVIERVEKLGSKKEVQTCIKKIRLDMPVLSEDFVGSDREDDGVRRGFDEPEISAEDDMQGEVRAEDMWDELLKEEADITESQVEKGPAFTALKSPSTDDTSASVTPGTPVQSGSQTKPDGMTPEMLQRIERNKQLALEKRLKKMGHLTPGSKLASSQMSSQTPTKLNTTNNHVISKPLEGKETNVNTENISDKEDLVSMVTNNVVNTELSADDSEMSEVIDKGPSQNIRVAVEQKENGQHWHSGTVVESDTGLQLDSQTEKMDTESTGQVVDNCSNSREMSEIIDNGECLQGLSQSSVESLAMSDIIEPVDNEKVVLKEKGNNVTKAQSDSRKVTDITDGKLGNDKVNIDVRAGKENSGTDEVDGTASHLNSKLDHFEDELTEDQLMETLEN